MNCVFNVTAKRVDGREVGPSNCNLEENSVSFYVGGKNTRNVQMVAGGGGDKKPVVVEIDYDDLARAVAGCGSAIR